MAQNNTPPNLDRDWSIDIDLGGVSAPTGFVDVALPDGYYKVQVTDSYVNKDKNPNRVIFQYKVIEGPFAGAQKSDGIGIPKGPEDNVRAFWRGMAESVGFSASDLDNGNVKLGLKAFNGRTGHIKFTAPNENSEYYSTRWLAPAEWTKQKQLFDAAEAAKAGTSTGTTITTSTSTARELGSSGGDSAPSTQTKADLMAKLGRSGAQA